MAMSERSTTYGKSQFVFIKTSQWNILLHIFLQNDFVLKKKKIEKKELFYECQQIATN